MQVAAHLEFGLGGVVSLGSLLEGLHALLGDGVEGLVGAVAVLELDGDVVQDVILQAAARPASELLAPDGRWRTMSDSSSAEACTNLATPVLYSSSPLPL